MKVRKAWMEYDRNLDRWVVEGNAEWYGLHCGESLQFHLGEKTLPARLEYGQSWYIIVNGVSFGLLRGRRYVVSVEI